MTIRRRIPLFPLRTVLFPDGPLPLRIFETRYLDMISQCMRDESGFGVVLISRGVESGRSVFHDIGTVAKIVDWYQGSDGVLGITATGEERFRVLERDVAADGLNFGRVETLPEFVVKPLPAAYDFLADILKGVLDDLGRLYESYERRYEDANWVGCRLAEILPIKPEDKQRCLEIDDSLERLEVIRGLVRTVRGGSAEK